jgi:uncharacterized protein
MTETVIWRRIMDDQSFEQATFTFGISAHQIEGIVLVAQAGAPLRLEYKVNCDARWSTKYCLIRQNFMGHQTNLALRAEGDRWQVNGIITPELDGCTDVDLGLSPSTNTLAINRLRLAEGAKGVIRAAWVKFPECTVAVLPQSYECIGNRQYLYRSLTSDFKALLDIDENGVVKTYERIWQQIALGKATSSSAE